jgi:hypothetical protein
MAAFQPSLVEKVVIWIKYLKLLPITRSAGPENARAPAALVRLAVWRIAPTSESVV